MPMKLGRINVLENFCACAVKKFQNLPSKITLMENGSFLTYDKDVSDWSNVYFTNIADTLDIERPIIDGKSVLAAIEQYKTNPSIIKIKQLIEPHHHFGFCKLSTREVE